MHGSNSIYIQNNFILCSEAGHKQEIYHREDKITAWQNMQHSTGNLLNTLWVILKEKTEKE